MTTQLTQPTGTPANVTTEEMAHHGRECHAVFFDRRDFTIAKVLEQFGLYTDMRATFNEEQPGIYRRSQYKDSQLWSRYDWRLSEDKIKCMHISVDVGCFHDFDCCGCMCELTYKIHLLDKYILVMKTIATNI